MNTMEDRFRSTIAKVFNELGPDAFACWFNCNATETKLVPAIQDIDYAFRSGFKDFFYSVTRDPVPQLLTDPENGVALEIGYGGGRLVNAASHMFNSVIGVDIHNCSSNVNQMLSARGVDNVELHETDGRSLPVPDRSVDFVWSFIVFVHLSSPEVLERYLDETYRVLKSGGIASLYYGRPYSYRTKTSKNPIIKRLYSICERVAEFALLDLSRGGYRCNPEAKANTVALMVTRRKMRRLARERGFSVVSQQSNKNWAQGFIVLRK